ncbi:MAG: hypothetical protein EDM79_00950 [Chloroflexi bacterium]|nr:MAG: hypothetical protein EDM79_00950 [Chloroflexota bacterium]
MEFEQIVKRLEFLDKQQRELKGNLAALKESLESFEATVDAVSKQIKTISRQMTDIAPAAKRMDQFESILAKQRTDILKLIDENEKNRTKAEKDAAKRIQGEIGELNKTISQVKTSFNPSEINKQIRERADENTRAVNDIREIKASVEEALRANEDVRHSIMANEETRKNDLKRISDIQGELTALRKRIDENRDKASIQGDSIRNVENRITELLASELERKQSQSAFLDQQRVAQVDRDRGWKEWQEKFIAFQKDAEAMDVQVQKLDETLRSAKKAQDTYMELNSKLERRINEVTEMQRLAEERLRQEWISFKADDQKRWTGYTLSSEEAFRDLRKEVRKSEEQTTAMSEIAQSLRDQVHQTTDVSEKQMQELMNILHEWMTSYQRIMGHGKKTVKK